MESIQYIGEHLLPGKLGHIFILLSFVSSLLAVAAYYFATKHIGTTSYASWRRIGRVGYSLHGISVFAIIGTMFYIMLQQYYEYHYVWEHVSEDLDFKYIFSAFWEGQEGSFLLWMFWHVILGGILMFSAKNWEAPVMAILALIQVFIGSMILGLYFDFGLSEFRLGSNPFMLLRDLKEAPIFAQADYLEKIKGTGLNPLLQNYWMTIHPPTLFLGFASTSIPFCYAIAGLWTKQHRAWLKPVLPWALFSGAILGTGILMGGAWAYEALSFGGYWAWDPVENMSLVPWIILLAGIHTNLIANSTGYSIKSSYIFYLLTFLMIVYSTFLTRSGVLGETSVHAFTEMGLEVQLISFIVFFLLLSVVLFFWQMRNIPTPKTEESAASREFWMFIGALVLLFSAVLITGSTSLPVYNKIAALFDPGFEGKTITDPITHYNKYQMWIAVFIALLSGVAQFLRYSAVNWKQQAPKVMKRLGILAAITVGLTFLTNYWLDIYAWQYLVLLFFCLFSVVANLDYLINFTRLNLKVAGSSLAHLGFGLMVVGSIASGLNKRHISSNPFATRGLLEEELIKKNVVLFKGVPLKMSGYDVTYVKDEFQGNNRLYEINYKKKSPAGEVIEEFNLFPTALYNNVVTKVAAYNPDTKHSLTEDLFTHIASIPKVEADAEFAKSFEDSLNYINYPISGEEPIYILDTILALDTMVIRKFSAELVSTTKHPESEEYEAQEGDLAIGAKIIIKNVEDLKDQWTVDPIFLVRKGQAFQFPGQINEASLRVNLSPASFPYFFTPEEQLDYELISFKLGDKLRFKDYEIEFSGVNKTPDHPDYIAQPKDIAVSANLLVRDTRSGETKTAAPVYLIRGKNQGSFKDVLDDWRLHFNFESIDPESGSIKIRVAKNEQARPKLVLSIAKKSFRTDYVVLEAIIFPGINFFWLGAILMMVGLGMSIVHRRNLAH